MIRRYGETERRGERERDRGRWRDTYAKTGDRYEERERETERKECGFWSPRHRFKSSFCFSVRPPKLGNNSHAWKMGYP